MGGKRSGEMRFPGLSMLAVLALAAVPALAEPLGTVTFVTGGQSHDFTVPEGSGGTLTYWDVGPVEIHAWHADGTILSLSFDKAGGTARAPGFGFLEPGGPGATKWDSPLPGGQPPAEFRGRGHLRGSGLRR